MNSPEFFNAMFLRGGVCAFFFPDKQHATIRRVLRRFFDGFSSPER